MAGRPSVTISTSPEPESVFTNTKLRVVCHRSNQQQSLVSFVAEWRRQSTDLEQIIHNHDNVSYECSPIDLGCHIEVKIKYDDNGLQTATRRFGPVRMEPDMAPLLERQVQAELFPARTMIDNTQIDLSLILTSEQLVIRYSLDQQQEYAFKLETLPFPELMRLDSNMVSFRLRTFSEPLSKFMSGILRKPLRYRLDVLDLSLESPLRRNYLLFRLLAKVKRKVVSTQLINQQIDRKRMPPMELEEVRPRKNSNPPISLGKTNRGKTPPKKAMQPAPPSPTPQDRTRGRSPSKLAIENDILKDIQGKGLFADSSSSEPQAELNLRDSFVELQQKYSPNMQNQSHGLVVPASLTDSLHASVGSYQGGNPSFIKSELKLSSSALSEQENRQLRSQLEDARGQIKLLNEEVRKLRKENTLLSLGGSQQSDHTSTSTSSSNPSEVVNKLLQKVDYLMVENRRLESERTQIIADKISTEVRWKKEKQEKDLLKREIDSLRQESDQMGVRFEVHRVSSNHYLAKNFSEESGTPNNRPPALLIDVPKERDPASSRLSPALRKNISAQPPSPLQSPSPLTRQQPPQSPGIRQPPRQ